MERRKEDVGVMSPIELTDELLDGLRDVADECTEEVPDEGPVQVHVDATQQSAPLEMNDTLFAVPVPEVVEPLEIIAFRHTDGRQMAAQLPPISQHFQFFLVQELHPVVVIVPDGARKGETVRFLDPDGEERKITVGVDIPHHGLVGLVDVPPGVVPGDRVVVTGLDGEVLSAPVPDGIHAGSSFVLSDMPQAHPSMGPPGWNGGITERAVRAQAFRTTGTAALIEGVRQPLSPFQLRPWLSAAREFTMNTDFEISAAMARRRVSFVDLLAGMRVASTGKVTIQALSDKRMFSAILHNLDIPQLPVLFSVSSTEDLRGDAEAFVDMQLSKNLHGAPHAVILKPTHLSHGEGVLALPLARPDMREEFVEIVEEHFRKCMVRRAMDTENQSRKSLRPGIVVQPKYESVVGFDQPLELCVLTLWGKARSAIWWWGRKTGQAGDTAQRNTWFVRRLARSEELSDDDTWEVLHEHSGKNPGFVAALTLFHQHIHGMAATAEHLAEALGAPFLRADFFVGSSQWGVRLNKVAYGCGADWRTRGRNTGEALTDDTSAVAQILQEGMIECRSRKVPEHFLGRVGVTGSKYEHLEVSDLPSFDRMKLPPLALTSQRDLALGHYAVPHELCQTPRSPHAQEAPAAGWFPAVAAMRLDAWRDSWFSRTGACFVPDSFALGLSGCQCTMSMSRQRSDLEMRQGPVMEVCTSLHRDVAPRCLGRREDLRTRALREGVS